MTEGAATMHPDPHDPEQRREFGLWAEQMAADFLRRYGYRILRRNYRCPLGELDIVAREGNTLVFVEVRATGGEDAARAALSLDDRKQAQLWRVANYFLKLHGLVNTTARFDAVVVARSSAGPLSEAATYSTAAEEITSPDGQRYWLMLYRNAWRYYG
ncbi:MAG: YraN family protein [Gemmatales bacterium]|nr:YraN family protein [Gemmatales bacterium]MDW8222125.1 YraN family protein [Gemmatales bacterium]